MSDVLINFKTNDASLDEAAAKLDKMTDAEQALASQAKKTYSEMDNAQTRVASSIEKMTSASKTLDKSIVGGAYKNYLKTIQKELGLTQKEIQGYIKVARQATQQNILTVEDAAQVKEFEIALEVLNEALKEYEQETGKAEKTTTSLRARLREMREELIALEDAGEQNTSQYRDLSNEAGELDDQIKDLNARISTLGSDTKGIDALISGVSGVAGAFAVAQGTAALFGDENEEIQKALLKVNAAMAILQGLQEVQNVLQKESAAMIALNTLKTNIQTAATTGATVAQKAYNVALAASPILIAITAISGLVLAYKALNKELTDIEKKAKLNQEVEEKTLDGYIKTKIELEALSQRVKQVGITFQQKQKIVKDYNKDFGDTLGKVKDFEQLEGVLNNKAPQFVEAMRQRSLAAANFSVAVEKAKELVKNQIASDADLYGFGYEIDKAVNNSWLGKIFGNEGSVEKSIQKQRKETEKTLTSQIDFLIQNGNKANDASEDIQKKGGFRLDKEEKKQKDNSVKNAHDASVAKLKEVKAGIDAELATLKFAGKEEEQIYLDKQKAAIDAQTKIALAETKGVNERLLITLQAEQEKFDLTNNFNLQLSENNLATQRKQIEAEFAAAQEGSAAQLKLRKEQLENEAAQEEVRLRSSKLNETDKAAQILAINKKLKADLQKMDDDDTRQKLEYKKEIDALNNQAEIIAKQRELIGVKDKAQLTRINKELSDLRLKGIQKEIDLNDDLHSRNLITEEAYQKQKLSLTNQYVTEENAVVKEGYDDRERIIQEYYNRVNRSLESTFSIISQSIDETIVNGDGIKAALGSAMQAYQEFVKIQQSDVTQAEKNRQMAVAGIAAAQSTINGIFADAANKRQAELDARLSDLDEAKQKELDDKNLTEAQKDQINEKYRKKEAAIKRQAWEADKRARRSQAIINTALAVVNALATAPTIIAGIALAAAAGIAGGIQIAKISSEQPPKFKRGKVNIYGPGSSTSDSIPAMISNGESVINAKSTRKWEDALTAINEDRFEHWLGNLDSRLPTFPEVPMVVYKNFEERRTGGVDYNKLAAALASKIPEPTYVQNGFDENGFYSWVVKGNNRTRYHNKKYSMR